MLGGLLIAPALLAPALRAPADGRVVDPRGEPVPGAHVSLRIPGGRTLLVENTDADGRFRDPALPDETEVELRVRVGLPCEELRWTGRLGDLDLERVQLDWSRGVQTGAVTPGPGCPSFERRDARVGAVFLGHAQDGLHGYEDFELYLTDGDRRVERDDALVVALEGCAPLVIPDFGARVHALDHRMPPLDLRLEPARTITGRVLDAAGEPVVRARVILVDPTELLGDVAERLTSGGTRPITDEAGRFEVTGLAHRPYRLRVVAGERGLDFASDPIPAGSRDVVLRPCAGDEPRRVAGRLVFPDVTATWGRASVYGAIPVPRPQCGSDRVYTTVWKGHRAEFVIEEFPPTVARLIVDAWRDRRPLHFPIGPGDREDLIVRIPNLCHLRVQWEGDRAPIVLGFHDANGCNAFFPPEQRYSHIKHRPPPLPPNPLLLPGEATYDGVADSVAFVLYLDGAGRARVARVVAEPGRVRAVQL